MSTLSSTRCTETILPVSTPGRLQLTETRDTFRRCVRAPQRLKSRAGRGWLMPEKTSLAEVTMLSALAAAAGFALVQGFMPLGGFAENWAGFIQWVSQLFA